MPPRLGASNEEYDPDFKSNSTLASLRETAGLPNDGESMKSWNFSIVWSRKPPPMLAPLTMR